jgi:uncharacterized iron-regulated membrane protein
VRVLAADLHRLVGVASTVFQVVIAVTGTWILLPVFSATFGPRPAALPRPAAQVAVTMERAVAEARRALPGLIVASAWLPNHESDPIAVYGRVPGNPLHSAYSSFVEINARTGAVQKAVDANQGNWREQWEAMVGPLHFGNWGGLPVKVLYSVLGLTPGLLAITGFALWLARRTNRSRATQPLPAVAAAGEASGAAWPAHTHGSR